MGTPYLSSADLHALRSVNDALLDPLSHDTSDAWFLDVCARFKDLCHGETSMAGVSFCQDEAGWISRDMPQKYLIRVNELMRQDPGTLVTSDPTVELLVNGPRHRHSGVGTTADLFEAGGLRVDDLQDSPMYRDVALPLGLPGSVFLLHSGASGEFAVHAAYPDAWRRPFGEATSQILSALLPGLAAGVGTLARLGNARRAIAVILDALEDGATVFDTAGQRVLARNRAMGLLAQRELDYSGLERAIHVAAGAAAWPKTVSKTGAGNADPTALSRGWRSTAGTSYRLRAVRLPSGCLSAREAILVLVQRVGPAVPAPFELMDTFGFTKREAEVAHRLALGHSNQRIAADLKVSPHTVRHHAEAVFVKAGVSSRKALALHLNSGARGFDPTG